MLIYLACLQDREIVLSRISAARLVGGFHIASSHAPNPDRTQGLQLWAVPHISSTARDTGGEAAVSYSCDMKKGETFASCRLCSSECRVARSREQSRFLDTACAVLYGSLSQARFGIIAAITPS